jgi:DNA-binding response OmpR family regulator
MRVLVIEDEAKVARALSDGLSREGYEVTVARTGPLDLVVLDLMLPGRDGLEVLATMRSRNRGIPVLVVTARDSVEDRVIGRSTPGARPRGDDRVHGWPRRSP